MTLVVLTGTLNQKQKKKSKRNDSTKKFPKRLDDSWESKWIRFQERPLLIEVSSQSTFYHLQKEKEA